MGQYFSCLNKYVTRKSAVKKDFSISASMDILTTDAFL